MMVEDKLSLVRPRYIYLPVVLALAEEFYDFFRVTYSMAGLEGHLRDMSNYPN